MTLVASGSLRWIRRSALRDRFGRRPLAARRRARLAARSCSQRRPMSDLAAERRRSTGSCTGRSPRAAPCRRRAARRRRTTASACCAATATARCCAPVRDSAASGARAAAGARRDATAVRRSRRRPRARASRSRGRACRRDRSPRCRRAMSAPTSEITSHTAIVSSASRYGSACARR